MKPRLLFFATPADFRDWLAAHHDSESELWVGFHKRGSGEPSLTWPESVDEALCFGWIDGLRKRLDGSSYAVRFTPRKAGSTWSAVNVRRAKQLLETGRMRPAGAAIFADRDEAKSNRYSYERQHAELAPAELRTFRANRAAWRYFQARPPWYRRTATWWVVSAKRAATRQTRLARLIEDSAAGRAIAPLARPPRRG